MVPTDNQAYSTEILLTNNTVLQSRHYIGVYQTGGGVSEIVDFCAHYYVDEPEGELE